MLCFVVAVAEAEQRGARKKHMDLRGTKVLVMGLGVHGGGLGVARWLLRQGAVVTITDMASAEALAGSIASLREAEDECGATVRYVLGEHRAEDFTSHEVLVINPAVRPGSPWVAMARAAGVRVETEMTLFFRRCPGPILGVTGTKGKTTTALLLAAMLRQEYPDTVAAGNLRVSALAALERITPRTPVVLELSSFQLVGLGEVGLSPRYACVTNLSPDHLDYHGSLAEYVAAKRQIFAHQGPGGIVVVNDALVEYGSAPPSELVSLLGAAPPADSRVLTFSIDPASAADCRVTVQGQVELVGEELCTLSDVALGGAHNHANVLAAATLARSFGISPASIRAAVRTFNGVEHRLELVREFEGVRYINDTTATNPAAAQAALATVAGPIVLIAGGADKALEFDALAGAIARRVKALVLLAGTATPRLLQALEAAQQATARLPILGPYNDFATAIAAARGQAVAGDAVLLSPGCASFGMFRNEFHRGEEFRHIVQALL